MEAITTLPDFQVPKIAGEDTDENKGTFTSEPLDKGFALIRLSTVRPKRRVK